MPYRIKKVKTGYKLWNIPKKRFAKALFKTRKAAKRQADNWMRYSHKKK